MSLLGRFRWWRNWRGGQWWLIRGVWLQGLTGVPYREVMGGVRWDGAIYAKMDEKTAEERLVQIVGTSDPELIRQMLDEAKDGWRPPRS